MAWLRRKLSQLTGAAYGPPTARAGVALPWSRYRLGPIDQIPRAVQVGRRTDLPRKLNPRRLYLVGTPPKWAVFRCPCGTGHRIDLNLAHPGRARWTVVLDAENQPSLRPSVDVRAERRCHFWLTAGEVRWCLDSGRQSSHIAASSPAERRSSDDR